MISRVDKYEHINYLWRNPTSLTYLCCPFCSNLYRYYLFSSKHIKQCTLWNFILCTVATTNGNLSHILTCALSFLLKVFLCLNLSLCYSFCSLFCISADRRRKTTSEHFKHVSILSQICL